MSILRGLGSDHGMVDKAAKEFGELQLRRRYRDRANLRLKARSYGGVDPVTDDELSQYQPPETPDPTATQGLSTEPVAPGNIVDEMQQVGPYINPRAALYSRVDGTNVKPEITNFGNPRSDMYEPPNGLNTNPIQPVPDLVSPRGQAYKRLNDLKEKREVDDKKKKKVTPEESNRRANIAIKRLSAAAPVEISNDITKEVIALAKKFGVDPIAAVAILAMESDYGRNAVTSPQGAKGSMQVMGDTFDGMKRFFTTKRNIRKYNIDPMLTEAARLMKKGEDTIVSGMLYLKYSELKGLKKNLWGAGYQSGVEHIIKHGRPSNDADVNMYNYDYNRVYVQLYNVLIPLMTSSSVDPMTQTEPPIEISEVPVEAPTAPTTPAGLSTQPPPTQQIGPANQTASNNAGNFVSTNQELGSLQTGDSMASQRSSAKPGGVVQPQGFLLMEQPSLIGNKANELNSLRQYYIDMAESSRMTGFAEDYLLHWRKVQEINGDLRYLNAMTAFYDLEKNNTARASKLWSEYLGRKVIIQSASDGNFYISFGSAKRQLVTREALFEHMTAIIDRLYVKKQQSGLSPHQEKLIEQAQKAALDQATDRNKYGFTKLVSTVDDTFAQTGGKIYRYDKNNTIELDGIKQPGPEFVPLTFGEK